MKTQRKCTLTLAGFMVASLATNGWAHDSTTHDSAAPAKEQSATDLAKKTQNPVANMISLPLQFNFNGNVGPQQNVQTVVNVQPVIPQKLNDDWLWIHRLIVPVIDQPSPVNNSGIGSTLYEGFLTPAKPGSIIWGVGPVIGAPTFTEDLGTDKWTAGPGLLLMKMHGPWVYGGLVFNSWSFGGSGENVNLMTAQPFLNYNFKNFYLNSAPVITADWEVGADHNQLLLPVGATIGKVFKFEGMPPINMRLGGYSNVITPDLGADWQVQFQLQFIFAK
jgi:hypothetical protein